MYHIWALKGAMTKHFGGSLEDAFLSVKRAHLENIRTTKEKPASPDVVSIRSVPLKAGPSRRKGAGREGRNVLLVGRESVRSGLRWEVRPEVLSVDVPLVTA